MAKIGARPRPFKLKCATGNFQCGSSCQPVSYISTAKASYGKKKWTNCGKNAEGMPKTGLEFLQRRVDAVNAKRAERGGRAPLQFDPEAGKLSYPERQGETASPAPTTPAKTAETPAPPTPPSADQSPTKPSAAQTPSADKTVQPQETPAPGKAAKAKKAPKPKTEYEALSPERRSAVKKGDLVFFNPQKNSATPRGAQVIGIDAKGMAQLEYQTLDGKRKVAVRPLSALLAPKSAGGQTGAQSGSQTGADQSPKPAPVEETRTVDPQTGAKLRSSITVQPNDDNKNKASGKTTSNDAIDKERMELELEAAKKELEAVPHYVGGYVAFQAPTIWRREQDGLRRRFNASMKRAKEWKATPAGADQIAAQRKKITAAERKLAKTTEAKWMEKNASDLAFDGAHTPYPAPDYEKAVLSAMEGDGGAALQSYYSSYNKKLSENIGKGVNIKEANYHAQKVNEYETQAEDLLKAAQQLKEGVILGVKLTGNYDADYQKVKDAYRSLAKKHHPDVGGDPAEFRRVQAEWETFTQNKSAPAKSTRKEPPAPTQAPKPAPAQTGAQSGRQTGAKPGADQSPKPAPVEETRTVDPNGKKLTQKQSEPAPNPVSELYEKEATQTKTKEGKIISIDKSKGADVVLPNGTVSRLSSPRSFRTTFDRHFNNVDEIDSMLSQLQNSNEWQLQVLSKRHSIDKSGSPEYAWTMNFRDPQTGDFVRAVMGASPDNRLGMLQNGIVKMEWWDKQPPRATETIVRESRYAGEPPKEFTIPIPPLKSTAQTTKPSAASAAPTQTETPAPENTPKEYGTTLSGQGVLFPVSPLLNKERHKSIARARIPQVREAIAKTKAEIQETLSDSPNLFPFVTPSSKLAPLQSRLARMQQQLRQLKEIEAGNAYFPRTAKTIESGAAGPIFGAPKSRLTTAQRQERIAGAEQAKYDRKAKRETAQREESRRQMEAQDGATNDEYSYIQARQNLSSLRKNGAPAPESMSRAEKLTEMASYLFKKMNPITAKYESNYETGDQTIIGYLFKDPLSGTTYGKRYPSIESAKQSYYERESINVKQGLDRMMGRRESEIDNSLIFYRGENGVKTNYPGGKEPDFDPIIKGNDLVYLKDGTEIRIRSQLEGVMGDDGTIETKRTLFWLERKEPGERKFRPLNATSYNRKSILERANDLGSKVVGAAKFDDVYTVTKTGIASPKKAPSQSPTPTGADKPAKTETPAPSPVFEGTPRPPVGGYYPDAARVISAANSAIDAKSPQERKKYTDLLLERADKNKPAAVWNLRRAAQMSYEKEDPVWEKYEKFADMIEDKLMSIKREPKVPNPGKPTKTETPAPKGKRSLEQQHEELFTKGIPLDEDIPALSASLLANAKEWGYALTENEKRLLSTGGAEDYESAQGSVWKNSSGLRRSIADKLYAQMNQVAEKEPELNAQITELEKQIEKIKKRRNTTAGKQAVKRALTHGDPVPPDGRMTKSEEANRERISDLESKIRPLQSSLEKIRQEIKQYDSKLSNTLGYNWRSVINPPPSTVPDPAPTQANSKPSANKPAPSPGTPAPKPDPKPAPQSGGKSDSKPAPVGIEKGFVESSAAKPGRDKLTKATVTVPSTQRGGFSPITLKGRMAGDFLAGQGVERRAGRWQVTHIPSGIVMDAEDIVKLLDAPLSPDSKKEKQMAVELATRTLASMSIPDGLFPSDAYEASAFKRDQVKRLQEYFKTELAAKLNSAAKAQSFSERRLDRPAPTQGQSMYRRRLNPKIEQMKRRLAQFRASQS